MSEPSPKLFVIGPYLGNYWSDLHTQQCLKDYRGLSIMHSVLFWENLKQELLLHQFGLR